MADQMDELRRSVATIIGEDPETWPGHGNAPLAIASVIALLYLPEKCSTCDGYGLVGGNLLPNGGGYETPEVCSTCQGKGTVDETAGGDPLSGLPSSCPDCSHPAQPAGEAVAWCQPMRNGMHDPRKFMVWFDDADKGIATFEDETEARAYFDQANVSYNCYLFGTLPLRSSPPNPPEGRHE